jgi:D-inositol-3-phosphate glycosyltransferase
MSHTLWEVKNRIGVSQPDPPCRPAVERAIAREADLLVCASEEERHVLETYYRAAPDHIRVIPCGVDLRRFRALDRDAARRSLDLNGNKTILFVGRIEPVKGVELLLSAAAQLDDEPPFQVLIVGGDGTGSELNRLRSIASTLGLDGRVTFLGPIEHDRLPLFYNAADVCVVPSHHESFGLVALEAMACGTPVIASDVGGLRVTVRDGETGYLIPQRSPEPFAQGIALLLGNDALRQSLGRTARQAAERFGWQEIAEAMEGVYAEAARGDREPAWGGKAIAV